MVWAYSMLCDYTLRNVLLYKAGAVVAGFSLSSCSVAARLSHSRHTKGWAGLGWLFLIQSALWAAYIFTNQMMTIIKGRGLIRQPSLVALPLFTSAWPPAHVYSTA